jgi:putative transposase
MFIPKEQDKRKKQKKFSNDLLDNLLETYESPDDLIGNEGILQQLTGALISRAMDGELTHALGYKTGESRPEHSTNYRNGSSNKRVKTGHGEVEITVPRDRNNEYAPIIVGKNQTRFNGFDKQIISMYSRGMTNQDIADHIADSYNTSVSKDLISDVTDSVLDEVKDWRNRPLEEVYAIVYMDGIHISVRDSGRVLKKCVHIAIGVTLEGQKDVLGMWIADNEGAKFWLSVMTEIHNRGVKDIFIACVDGLKGFPDAIGALFPKTDVQLCIVHLIRNSMKYVPHKDMKAVCAGLKAIYTAINEEDAFAKLGKFEEEWVDKYPSVVAIWERNWQNIIPFLAYPASIRRVIYTTNTIEGYNRQLRKVSKNRGVMPSDTAVYKLLYLATRNIIKKWTMPSHHWKEALNQFAIMFADRMPK